MKPIRGNVISNDTFQPRVADVLGYVADSVANTLGPYGHNTLIQSTDRVVSTKDGWNVLKNITFDNTIDNSIKSLIETVAHSVVLHVGDGSTTSTYASHKLLQNLLNDPDINDYPIRTLEDTLVKCVDAIEIQLRKNAVQITDENMAEMIHKVALVSSNWNKELADMIAEIYTKTHNPIIKVQNSGTERTYVEYVEGYDLSGKIMSNMYINNVSDAKCELDNPKILMFNFQLTAKYVTPLVYLAAMMKLHNETFVIMAPGYDKAFIDQFNALNNNSIRTSGTVINMVPVMYDNKFAIDRDCVSDFTILLNAKTVTQDDDDIKDMLDDITDTMSANAPAEGETVEEYQARKAGMIKTAVAYMLENYCGSCGKAVINDKGILVSNIEFNEFQNKLIQTRKDAVEAEIVAKTKEFDALTMITDDIRMKRIRLGKLQCHMGIIKVGGFGDADLKAKKDALEDTTRACEAAYRDGITIGSSLATLCAIEDVSNDLAELYRDQGGLDGLEAIIMNAFCDTFISVFARLVRNKYANVSDTAIINIVKTATEQRIGYNLLSDSFDHNFDVINPVNVDVEVIRATLKLIIICMTSDQFVFKRYDNMDILGEGMSANQTIDEATAKILDNTVRIN